MKLSAQEEYGLRCLLRVANEDPDHPLTIPQIGEAEGLSVAYVGKLMRLLRQAGYVQSTRGQSGGYVLAAPASEIRVASVLGALGGRLVEADFCRQFSGLNQVCTHTVDCAMRSLWQAVQSAVDDVLSRVTLADLTRPESDMARWISEQEIGVPAARTESDS